MTLNKLITTEMILENKPCERYTPEKISALIGTGKTLLEILDGDIPEADRIWVITRFLPDLENRKFAIWCARQCKTDKKEITYYIDAIENYYIKNTITKTELNAADWAAYSAADRAAYSAAYWAAYSAADRAAYSAADRAAERKKQIDKLKEIIQEYQK